MILVVLLVLITLFDDSMTLFMTCNVERLNVNVHIAITSDLPLEVTPAE